MFLFFSYSFYCRCRKIAFLSFGSFHFEQENVKPVQNPLYQKSAQAQRSTAKKRRLLFYWRKNVIFPKTIFSLNETGLTKN